MRRFAFLAPALAVLFLDQATKLWCVRHLTENRPVPWLDHVAYLTLTFNTRGAFSLFPLPNLFFIWVVLVLLVGLAAYALLFPLQPRIQWVVGLTLGGGAGNLLDRIRLGTVVDFVDFRFWPVFNLADSAVTLAMGLLVWFALVSERKREKTPA